MTLSLLACGGRPRPPKGPPPLEQGIALERRADDEVRRTREGLYDQALAKYQQACDAGVVAGCEARQHLDEQLRDRRGTCNALVECREQALAWLPEWRGERRLQALCLGERMTFEYGDPPPAWDPDTAACVALGEYYRASKLSGKAGFYYQQGCALGAPAACRGDAERILADVEALAADERELRRASALAFARTPLARACDLGDAEACHRLAEVALAQQALRFPDENALRMSAEAADPHEYLRDARDAETRACEAGAATACDQIAAIEARIAHVDALLSKGCAFRDNCDAGEMCNRATGRCESRDKRGKLIEAYDKGLSAFDRRDYAAARKAFEAARDMNPQLPGPWRWLGVIALREGRHSDCVEAFVEALDLNPSPSNEAAMRALLEQCKLAANRRR